MASVHAQDVSVYLATDSQRLAQRDYWCHIKICEASALDIRDDVLVLVPRWYTQPDQTAVQHMSFLAMMMHRTAAVQGRRVAAPL